VSETDTTVHHPLFARFFDRLSTKAEEAGQAEFRREALAGLSGVVLELGAGNGLNFAHYPSTVTDVLAVEPEPYLRERARRRAGAAPVPVSVVDGVADALPADDASMDAAVVSLVLCSVPNQARALAELHRVVRPGGQLRFYEHVVAESPGFARFQRAATLVWPRVAGGCHADRDTLQAIRRAGFEVESSRRFAWRPGVLELPVTPRVIGIARRMPA
jgi:ubiquinone/menaquinone biosynthesis C-methylase UbiE